MTTVYFVRHGEYEGRDKYLALRSKGFPLNKPGKSQANKLADQFSKKSIAAIYSSPLTRSLETATIIGERLNLKVYEDKRLLEVKTPFDGITKEKFEEMGGGNMLYKIPAQIARGESFEEVESRMLDFLKYILNDYKNKSVVAISHGDPIMILEYQISGKNFAKIDKNKDFYIDVGHYFEFVFNGKKLVSEEYV